MLVGSASRSSANPSSRSRTRWVCVGVGLALAIGIGVPTRVDAQTSDASSAEEPASPETADASDTEAADTEAADTEAADTEAADTAANDIETADTGPDSTDIETADTGSDSTDAEPEIATIVAPPAGPLTPPGGVPEILDPRAEERRRETERRPPPEPETPAEPLPLSSMRVEIQPRLTLLTGSSMDDALRAHRYVPNGPSSGGHVGAEFSVVEPWFWIGGRLGLRGRTWRHPDRDGPVATAGDLQLTVGVRGDVDQVVEFGAVIHGGVGVVDLRVNGVAAGQLVGRFGLEGVLAFRVGPNFSFGPRIGWEYFQWDGVNADGHWLELGGPFLGLSLEGRQ
ncbi:MAG: hypothetical protein AB8I08_02770 [Sandaracinaceae bacterium]